MEYTSPRRWYVTRGCHSLTIVPGSAVHRALVARDACPRHNLTHVGFGEGVIPPKSGVQDEARAWTDLILATKIWTTFVIMCFMQIINWKIVCKCLNTSKWWLSVTNLFIAKEYWRIVESSAIVFLSLCVQTPHCRHHSAFSWIRICLRRPILLKLFAFGLGLI